MKHDKLNLTLSGLALATSIVSMVLAVTSGSDKDLSERLAKQEQLVSQLHLQKDEGQMPRDPIAEHVVDDRIHAMVLPDGPINADLAKTTLKQLSEWSKGQRSYTNRDPQYPLVKRLALSDPAGVLKFAAQDYAINMYVRFFVEDLRLNDLKSLSLSDEDVMSYMSQMPYLARIPLKLKRAGEFTSSLQASLQANSDQEIPPDLIHALLQSPGGARYVQNFVLEHPHRTDVLLTAVQDESFSLEDIVNKLVETAVQQQDPWTIAFAGAILSTRGYHQLSGSLVEMATKAHDIQLRQAVYTAIREAHADWADKSDEIILAWLNDNTDKAM